ncbi:Tautomerase PptA [Erwinia sp. OLTSP20]|uniref:tautomerase PptA n=1 Tax=unclassified Erwinia TaxID=2622719 RepID=UPI000C1A20C8|nr:MULTISPECIES: tautomerase PptA [unclassified Erwinia]PIJ51715.1 Tautomerase PptA [Erwinia sp. OAMSP11]PIJ75602.1 Tautomerase PptA [Erwinia sp. OLSSP12]PIJ84907.1 Tautomerase PptA [Erwinia sp. OLCASP19]PIJ86686.1 Tautomerase PptA [Erwinia sp. OLMTSP26]PIJ88127.1 Tautomerase PptA [Erwinia sp. OLMDSP33]
MPHIELSFFSRDLSDEQQQALANDLCEVVKKHFGSRDESLSVALHPVAKENWKTQVYDPRIRAEIDRLVKKPGYEM